MPSHNYQVKIGFANLIPLISRVNISLSRVSPSKIVTVTNSIFYIHALEWISIPSSFQLCFGDLEHLAIYLSTPSILAYLLGFSGPRDVLKLGAPCGG
jgi:hypothetical protein